MQGGSGGVRLQRRHECDSASHLRSRLEDLWWQADPRDGSVLIFLAHNMVEVDQLANGIGWEVYDAITPFQALASALPR